MENVETLEARIKGQTKGTKAEEVLELECAGSVATSLTNVFDKFTNLEILNLASVGVSSLKGFPALPNLCELDLSENKISGGLEALDGCQKLFVLKLTCNPIEDLSTLKPLANLALLRELDLSECEVSKVEKYRETVFDLIKSLVSLDGFDKDNKPVEDGEYCSENEEEDEEGSDSEVDDEDDEDDEDDGEDEVGLSYLQKSDLGDDDSKDYEAPEGAEDDDDEDVSDEEEIDEDEVKQVAVEESKCGELRRGRKRKPEPEPTEEDSN